MRFDVDIKWKEMPSLVRRAIGVGTLAGWKKRFENTAAQIRSNPMVEEFVRERFALECAMEELLHFERVRGRWPRLPEVDISTHRLLGFAAALANVHERLSRKAQHALEGRVRGALKDQGLASIAFELQVLSNLMHNGVDVVWNDLENGGGFDFLATYGDLSVEIECKTFSGDIGRQVHRRRLYELAAIVRDPLIAAIEAGGSISVQVTIPKNLTGASVPHIATRIVSCLSIGTDFEDEVCRVTTNAIAIEGSLLDTSQTAAQPQHDVIRNFVHDRFNIDNPNAFLVGRRGGPAALFILSSGTPDRVTKYMGRELSEGAKQLSGSRPGILCAQLIDMTPGEFSSLTQIPVGSLPGNAFQKMIGDFLRSENRKHVHSIRLSTLGNIAVSESVRGNILDRGFRERGPAYKATNPEHPLADDPRIRVFS